MKKLTIILLMIIMIMAPMLLIGSEIKIIKSDGPDFKKVEYNELIMFLVSPLWMNEVQKDSVYNKVNEDLIFYYEKKQSLFDKGIKEYEKQQIKIMALAFTTAAGFTITIGLLSGLIAFFVFNYYYPRI